MHVEVRLPQPWASTKRAGELSMLARLATGDIELQRKFSLLVQFSLLGHWKKEGVHVRCAAPLSPALPWVQQAHAHRSLTLSLLTLRSSTPAHTAKKEASPQVRAQGASKNTCLKVQFNASSCTQGTGKCKKLSRQGVWASACWHTPT